MTDTDTALNQLDNVSPPPFRAQMTTSRSAPGADEDSIQIAYEAADTWKVTDGDKVTIRNGAQVWTIHPDRVFIERADRVLPPFTILLWSTYRSKGYHIDGLRAVELDDGRPGYLVAVSYQLGSATAQLELSVDRGSGLLRQRKDCATAGETAADARFTEVNYAPAFVDREFEPVIPPAAQVVDESHAAEPGTARRVLIALVAKAASPWNRLRHPERR
jgi:outer membrane lipoprotein-sorting protein